MIGEKKNIYHEKRAWPRAPIGVIARVESPQGARHYYSRNISPGGIFLLAEEPLGEETRVKLEIFLPLVTLPVKAEGEVVWRQRQEPSGFAVRFVEISEGARKLIRWVVDRYLGQPTEEQHP